MAAGRIVLSQYFPARDRNGRLVPGALLYVYTNGTTTKASIFAEEALSTPLANPVAANSSGQFPAIWASDAVQYTLSITAADGSSIGNPSVFDDYSVSTDADTAAVALAEAAAAASEAIYEDILEIEASGSEAAAIATRAKLDGTNFTGGQPAQFRAAIGADLAANVNYTPAGTGAVTRTVQSKLRDRVNLLDYVPSAEHAAILAGTSTYDATADLQTAIAANLGKTIDLPAGQIVLGNVGGLASAGQRIIGNSRYGTVIKALSGMATGTAIFYNPLAATNTSSYCEIANIRFRFDGQNIIGADLSSVSNTVVDQCYIAGSELGATVTGVGVKFGSPLDLGSYSNHVRDCAFYSLDIGVQYLVNANSNMVSGGECIFCDIGVDAAPVGYLDTPRVIGMRFEGGGIGIKEKSEGANYIACRFEANSVADIDFIDNGSGDQSKRPLVLGGHTATTVTPLRNLANAVSPIIIAPDMGRYDVEASTGKKYHHGREVFAARTTAINPTLPEASVEYAGFYYDTLLLRNQVSLEWTNAANTNSVISVGVDSSDRTVVRSFSRATGGDNDVLMGGGAAVRAISNAATDIGTGAVRYKDGYFSGNLYCLTGALSLESAGGIVYIGGVPILRARKTGWTTATGTATRTTFDTATVTTAQLAERVKALIDDLHATAGHGIIGT